MKFSKSKVLLAAGTALSVGWLSLTAFAGDQAGNIALPSDFRSWTHTKSTVEPDKKNPFYGFRNIYVNDTGIEAMRNGTAYPDGSQIVMSFHEPVLTDGAYAQGKLIKYVLMLKDSSLTATDGWTYEAYAAGSTTPIVGANVVDKCHGCHTARKESDFVFSTYVK